jgi:hypothetical protein
MALNIDTLYKNKDTFSPVPGNNENSYSIWDLTRPSVNYIQSNTEVESVYVITDYYQMRPDIIAAIHYGDQGKMGSLLKFNDISNPFSISAGNFLLIPTEKTINDSFRLKKLANQNAASSNSNTNTNTDPSDAFKKNQEQKKFKVSEGRKKFLNSKIKNQPALILSPNVTQPGEKTIEKKNGYIIFAPNAGGGGTNIPVN